MRTTLILKTLTLAAGLVLTLSACSTDAAEDGTIHIVVTTAVLGDIVEEAFGSAASLAVIMPGGADPHEFEPSARQVSEIRSADLVVANGLDLEEGLEDVLNALDDELLIDVGPLVDPLPLGDGGDLDPHIWLDPVRMVMAVDALASKLEALETSTDWQMISSGYRAELVATDRWIRERLTSIPSTDRVLVTGHSAFGYFADRYGFEVIATVLPGATTMVDPSASGFAEVVAVLEASNAPVVFTDIGESQALAEKLVQQVGRDVLVVPLYTGTLGGGGSEPDDYLAIMRWNTDLIALAFER